MTNSARTCRKCGTVEFSKKLCSPPLFQLGCRCGVGMDEALPWDQACDVWNTMNIQPRACNCCGTQPELIEYGSKRFVYKCSKCMWGPGKCCGTQPKSIKLFIYKCPKCQWGPVVGRSTQERAVEHWDSMWGKDEHPRD